MANREHRAFLALSKSPGNVSWAGNDGYSEIPTRYYTFDSKVANSRYLVPGVLIIVRRDDLLLGIGRIHTLDSTVTQKIARKCPTCSTQTLDRRKNDYRCTTCKLTFLDDQIVTASVEVVSFRAYFEKSWIPASRKVTGKDAEPLLYRNDKQSAIRGLSETELLEIANLLGVAVPEVNSKGFYNL